MMRHLHVSLALLLAPLLTEVVQGEILLFQRVINVNRGVNNFDTDQFNLDLKFDDDYFAPTNGVTLFDDLVISPVDVGTTYDATSASDPAFSTVAGRLTDGLNEFIKVSMNEDQVGGRTEQRGWEESFFFDHATPPDLAGSTVGRVSLSLDSFVFLSSAFGAGTAPLITGQPFDVSLTLSIFAEIPEPAAIRLLLLGLMVVGVSPFSRQRWV